MSRLLEHRRKRLASDSWHLETQKPTATVEPKAPGAGCGEFCKAPYDLNSMAFLRLTAPVATASGGSPAPSGTPGPMQYSLCRGWLGPAAGLANKSTASTVTSLHGLLYTLHSSSSSLLFQHLSGRACRFSWRDCKASKTVNLTRQLSVGSGI